jgi:glutathione S-transferase
MKKVVAMPSSLSGLPVLPIKLHRHPLSGHSHRVELMLSLLGLPYELIHVDLLAKAQKSPAHLAMHPFGQVPVIEDSEVILWDSNAILVYLASRYADDSWLPTDPVRAATVQRWLSIAAGLVAFGPAAARLIALFRAPFNVEEVKARAQGLLAVMETELQKTLFLAGDMPTIADIANYTYIAHAPEGGISLAPYPHLQAWLRRIEALPGFVPMGKKAPLGSAA